MTKSKLAKPSESYSEWSALDVALMPDESYDRRSSHNIFAYVFAFLSVTVLAIGLFSIVGASNLGGMITTIALLLSAIGLGILAIFCAVMSGRHFRTRKLRLSHRSVYDTASDSR